MSTSNAQAGSKAYAAFIPELWSTKIVELLHKGCVMLQCVNRNYEGEIRQKGDTVHIRSFSAMAITDYDGSIEDAAYETPTPVEQELVIDQAKMWGLKIDDVAKAQSDINILTGYAQEAADGLEKTIDTFLLAKHADVPAGNTIGTVSVPIALTKDNIYSQFVQLAAKLKGADAVGKGKMKPFVIVNPVIEALLLQAPEFIHATQSGDTTLREGSIGRIAGLDVLLSTNFVAVSGKYYILAGTNEAITFAEQLTKTETVKDKSFFGDLVRGLAVYGAKTVQPNALAKVIATVA